MRDTIASVLTPAGEKLGKARFLVYGKDAYPDATFTLRLSYGTVQGFPYNGTIAPPFTTFYGLYDRAASFSNQPPFNLTPKEAAGVGKLDLSTPLDFVSTGDIIGGNSGSPVVNRDGELVGLIFDGNIESMAGDFVYDGTKNRAVAVHSAGMIGTPQALRSRGTRRRTGRQADKTIAGRSAEWGALIGSPFCFGFANDLILLRGAQGPGITQCRKNENHQKQCARNRVTSRGADSLYAKRWRPPAKGENGTSKTGRGQDPTRVGAVAGAGKKSRKDQWINRRQRSSENEHGGAALVDRRHNGQEHRRTERHENGNAKHPDWIGAEE